MHVLQVTAITVRGNGNVILKDLSFSIGVHEQWAIVGPSGSGKTSLLQTLSRNYFDISNDGMPASREKIVLVEQQHHFKNLSNTSTFYYQQRFNASDADDAITVKEALLQNMPGAYTEQTGYSPEVEHILDLLRLRNLLPVRLIQLSNGENKRLQIAKALLLHPTILMLDSAFT